jgi:hypothetical protein
MKKLVALIVAQKRISMLIMEGLAVIFFAIALFCYLGEFLKVGIYGDISASANGNDLCFGDGKTAGVLVGWIFTLIALILVLGCAVLSFVKFPAKNLVAVALSALAFLLVFTAAILVFSTTALVGAGGVLGVAGWFAGIADLFAAFILFPHTYLCFLK